MPSRPTAWSTVSSDALPNWRDGSFSFEQRGVEFPGFWLVNAVARPAVLLRGPARAAPPEPGRSTPSIGRTWSGAAGASRSLDISYIGYVEYEYG
jgi:hypothetical protein